MLAQACAQDGSSTISYELKLYDFVNLPEGISNLHYGVYPDTTIYPGTYSNLSEVKNETVEELLASRLSERSLTWHQFNYDFEEERDLTVNYQELFDRWIAGGRKYELLSLLTYEYNDDLYAEVLLRFNDSSNVANFIIPKPLIKKEGRWFFTNSEPSSMLTFFVGLEDTQPESVYNILNQQPANKGEEAILEKSLDENDDLDFEKLSQALRNIRDEAETNPAIEAILLPNEMF